MYKRIKTYHHFFSFQTLLLLLGLLSANIKAADARLSRNIEIRDQKTLDSVLVACDLRTNNLVIYCSSQFNNIDFSRLQDTVNRMNEITFKNYVGGKIIGLDKVHVEWFGFYSGTRSGGKISMDCRAHLIGTLYLYGYDTLDFKDHIDAKVFSLWVDSSTFPYIANSVLTNLKIINRHHGGDIELFDMSLKPGTLHGNFHKEYLKLLHCFDVNTDNERIRFTTNYVENAYPLMASLTECLDTAMDFSYVEFYDRGNGYFGAPADSIRVLHIFLDNNSSELKFVSTIDFRYQVYVSSQYPSPEFKALLSCRQNCSYALVIDLTPKQALKLLPKLGRFHRPLILNLRGEYEDKKFQKQQKKLERWIKKRQLPVHIAF